MIELKTSRAYPGYSIMKGSAIGGVYRRYKLTTTSTMSHVKKFFFPDPGIIRFKVTNMSTTTGDMFCVTTNNASPSDDFQTSDADTCYNITSLMEIPDGGGVSAYYYPGDDEDADIVLGPEESTGWIDGSPEILGFYGYNGATGKAIEGRVEVVYACS